MSKTLEEKFNDLSFSFVGLKEFVTEKVNKKIEFNFEKGKKYIEDLLFFSEIVKNGLSLDTRGNFDIILKRKMSKIVNVECFDALEGFYSYYDRSKSLKELLIEAIAIFDIVRDSFSHNVGYTGLSNDGTYLRIFSNPEDDYDESNASECLYFESYILPSYVKFLGYGILPLTVSDYEISKRLDKDYSTISSVLKIDKKESSNIAYKATPARIDFLLKKCNYSINLFNSLPPFLFDRRVSDERIKLLLGKNGDISKLSLIPSMFFYDIDKYNEILLLICLGDKDENGKINNLVNLEELYYIPPHIVTFPDDIFLDCIHFYLSLTESKNGNKPLIDKKDIRNCDKSLFNCGYDISKIRKLAVLLSDSKYLVDIKKFDKEGYKTLRLIEYLMGNYSGKRFNPENLKNLPIGFYNASESFVNSMVYFMNNLDDPNDICEYDSDFFTKFDYDKYCNLFNCLNNKFFEKISSSFFRTSFKGNLDKLISLFGEKYVLDNFDKIPNFFFDSNFSFDNFMLIYSKIIHDSNRKVFDDDVVISFRLIPTIAFLKYTSTDRLNYLLGEDKDYRRLCNLPSMFFSNEIILDTLDYFFRGFDNYKDFYNLSEDNLSALNKLFLSSKKSIDVFTRIKIICGDNFDCKIFAKVPFLFDLTDFSNEDVEKYIKFYTNGDETKWKNVVSHINYFLPPWVILNENSLSKVNMLFGFFKSFDKFVCVPEFCFSDDVNIDVLSYIVSIIGSNYDYLNKLPKEIFLLDYSTRSKSIIYDCVNHIDYIRTDILKSFVGTSSDDVLNVCSEARNLFSRINVDRYRDQTNIDELDKKKILNFDLSDITITSFDNDIEKTINKLSSVCNGDSVRRFRFSFDKDFYLELHDKVFEYINENKIVDKGETRKVVCQLVHKSIQDVFEDGLLWLNCNVLRMARNGTCHVNIRSERDISENISIIINDSLDKKVYSDTKFSFKASYDDLTNFVAKTKDNFSIEDVESFDKIDYFEKFISNYGKYFGNENVVKLYRDYISDVERKFMYMILLDLTGLFNLKLTGINTSLSRKGATSLSLVPYIVKAGTNEKVGYSKASANYASVLSYGRYVGIEEIVDYLYSNIMDINPPSVDPDPSMGMSA